MSNSPEYANQELRRPDAQGRIVIGKEHADETYSVERQPDGVIVLRPVVVIDRRDAWLYRNSEALESVRLGLQQASEGKVRDLGSFKQYADDSDDED